MDVLRAHAIGAASLVHVDPFDFRASGPAAVSAHQLVTCLAAASIPTFAWYGLTSRSAPHDLFHEVTTTAPTAPAWSAELRLGGQRANAADDYRRTYNAVGGPTAWASPRLDMTRMITQIQRHIYDQDDVDFTVVDLTGASGAQADEIFENLDRWASDPAMHRRARSSS